MPPSRYVSSRRLLRMTVFLAVAVVVLVTLHAGLRALGSGGGVRLALVVAWLVGLPVVGWHVWRGGKSDPSGH